jgi:hypothetical protein
MMKRNILVTGTHRSGTTFLGKMLSSSYNVGSVIEPFNFDSGVEGIDSWFLHINNDIEEHKKYREIVTNLIHGKAKFKKIQMFNKYNNPIDDNRLIRKITHSLVHSRSHLSYLTSTLSPFVNHLVYKDSNACLSSEYFHKYCGFDVLVMIRHPAAFCASIARLNWNFNFDYISTQKNLCIEHNLFPLLELESKLSTKIEKHALLWMILNKVLFEYLSRNKSMIPIKHEDLSMDPVNQLKSIFDQLQLNYTNKIERTIKKYTSSSNPIHPKGNNVHDLKRYSKKNIKRWKNILTQSEVEKIHNLTYDLSDKYYSSNDW